MEVVNVIQVKPCLFIRRMHSVELDQLTFEELKGINDVSSQDVILLVTHSRSVLVRPRAVGQVQREITPCAIQKLGGSNRRKRTGGPSDKTTEEILCQAAMKNVAG
jgi:hypothetical protein